MLSVTALDMKFRFHWRSRLRRNLPGYIGAVRVAITPPADVPDDELNRLVFRIPEFFEDGREVLRIDSFHYHRVTSPRSTIQSQKAQRNLLSFRTIQNIWRAGIFDYSNGRLQRTEIERRIRYEITSQLENVLACYTREILPASRRLSLDEEKNLGVLVLIGIPAADDKRLFHSFA